MADEPQQIRGINWRETFPFTHLFRAFRIAVHPSKLMLGLIALLALYAGGRLLDGIWSPRHLAVPGEAGMYEQSVRTGSSSEDFTADRVRQRDAIEAGYAAKLIDLKVVTDPKLASEAARKADKLGDVKEKLFVLRNDAESKINAD